MTLAQRTYLHTDGDNGADPLTSLLNPGPNRSILPREPVMDLKGVWYALAGEAIITALAILGWLIWRTM